MDEDLKDPMIKVEANGQEQSRLDEGVEDWGSAESSYMVGTAHLPDYPTICPGLASPDGLHADFIPRFRSIQSRTSKNTRPTCHLGNLNIMRAKNRRL